MVGVVNQRNPEQGNFFKAYPAYTELIELISNKLKISIIPSQIEGGLFGLKFGKFMSCVID